MNFLYKTTVNPPTKREVNSDAGDTFLTYPPDYGAEAAAAVPIDQQTLLEAPGDVMGMLAAEQRREREREVSALREKIATLEGKVDALMALMQGKGQLVDLPPLPKFEASDEQIITKLRVSRWADHYGTRPRHQCVLSR